MKMTQMVNPFILRRRWIWQMIIKTAMGFPLIFLRIPFVVASFFGSILFASLCGLILACLPPHSHARTPIRKLFQFPCKWLLRLSLFFHGIIHIKVQDINGDALSISAIDAPIICIAPHSSFFDILPYILFGFPSIVAKHEIAKSLISGSLLMLSDPILVQRDSASSRAHTIEAIKEKAKSEKVVIFPEGTCTNRSALIDFKLGAFLPGYDIAPLVLDYNLGPGWNHKTDPSLDTVTWTWEGPGLLEQYFLSMCRLYTILTITILPTYKPTEAEKNDPKLFAYNVRRVVSLYTGKPTSYYTYNDSRILPFADKYQLPKSAVALKFVKFCRKLASMKRRNSTVSTKVQDLEHGRKFSARTTILVDESNDLGMGDSKLLEKLTEICEKSIAAINKHPHRLINSKADLIELLLPSTEASHNPNLTNNLRHEMVPVEINSTLIMGINRDLKKIEDLSNCVSLDELLDCLQEAFPGKIEAAQLRLVLALCDTRTSTLLERLQHVHNLMAVSQTHSNRNSSTTAAADLSMRPFSTGRISHGQVSSLLWLLLGIPSRPAPLAASYQSINNPTSCSSLSDASVGYTFEELLLLLRTNFADEVGQNAPYLLP